MSETNTQSKCCWCDGEGTEGNTSDGRCRMCHGTGFIPDRPPEIQRAQRAADVLRESLEIEHFARLAVEDERDRLADRVAELERERDFIRAEWRNVLISLTFAESGCRMTTEGAERITDTTISAAMKQFRATRLAEAQAASGREGS